MRRISIIFLFTANIVCAQSWCASQAVWHHSYHEGNSGIVGHVLTTYTGDTVIGGVVSQRLDGVLNAYSEQSQNYFTESIGPVFTTGTGDLVEKWNGFGFDTLYWFGASLGDRWIFDSGAGGLTVMDTGMLVISGVPLRYLIVQFDEFSTGPAQDTIVERLGFLNHYWDGQGVFLVDAGLGGLRCYSDVDISSVRLRIEQNQLFQR